MVWAVATRARADGDLIFVHRAMGAILDRLRILSTIGVDATKPGGADFAQRPTVADKQRARVRHSLSAAGIQRKSRFWPRIREFALKNITRNQRVGFEIRYVADQRNFFGEQRIFQGLTIEYQSNNNGSAI